jgi:hypothetical protein
MKRRHWWFRSSSLLTVSASAVGLLGLSQQASADGMIPQELEDQYAQQVVQAEASANGGQFARALQVSEGIPSNSKHHTGLQQKQSMWSKLLLQQAREIGARGEPQKAVALLRPLVNRPSLAPEAQNLLTQWQRQAALLAQVETAQASQDWVGVLQSIESIRSTDGDLANSAKLQEISQIATQKAFATPVSTTDLSQPEITPIRSVHSAIRLDDSFRPINLEVGSTAIDLAAIEKQTAPKASTVVPQPLPRALPVVAPRVIPSRVDVVEENRMTPVPADPVVPVLQEVLTAPVVSPAQENLDAPVQPTTDSTLRLLQASTITQTNAG